MLKKFIETTSHISILLVIKTLHQAKCLVNFHQVSLQSEIF